jgi:hypothetical protein
MVAHENAHHMRHSLFRYRAAILGKVRGLAKAAGDDLVGGKVGDVLAALDDLFAGDSQNGFGGDR